ncbi:hypothetical protein ACFQVC_39530 [Streptomyces monticola]|uniref:Uncharacterized protein n=1 Tax=Streptomyces monticola TaxID=2666263 RepID=A0ABW2JY09_9ACTN
MHDIDEAYVTYARQFRDVPPTAPVLRLAGADEDENAEPQVVRGID